MDTQLIDLDKQYDEGIDKAAEIIKAGGVVAFPTETVYGLGANALDAKAVGRIFEAKGRPADNPLIVHVCDMEMFSRVTSGSNEKAFKLIEEFWPGPLTLVLKKSELIPYEVTAGLDTVAVRMPKNWAALDLIEKCEVPIAAPSANLSQRPSPTAAQHVLSDMAGRIPLILDGGPCKVGVESTVLDLTGDVPELLRPGGVPLERLQKILGTVSVSNGVVKGQAKSPGMKYKHYSPKADVVIVRGKDAAPRIKRLYDEYTQKGEKCSIIAPSDSQSEYGDRGVHSMGKSMEDVARNFFATLRELDEQGFSKIIMEAVSEKGLGLAVMDRAVRAAGFNLIEAGEE